MRPAQSARPVLGEQGWRWLQDGEMSLLPALVRPSRLRWVWVVLAVVVAGLVVVAVLVGARL